MKWVAYNSYQFESSEVLYDLATTFLFQLQRVNHPSRLSDDFQTCVSAGPGYLKLNFSSRAIQSLVVANIANIEGVTDEIWERVSHLDSPLPRLINMLINLKYETDQLLDNLSSCAALDAQDLINLSNMCAQDVLSPAP